MAIIFILYIRVKEGKIRKVRSMHITITGNLGSGKSTICRLLSEKYKFEVYSTGKVQRELARKMNMSTLELNQLMRTDQHYDRMIDDETARISRENKDKDIIFDSRLAWNFVEHSFKVFVSVSLEVAAARVMNDKRGEEERYTDINEAKKLLAERAATEKIRYKEIYNINYMDLSNYDLVIDNTYCTPEKISEIIYREALEFEENPWTETKILVSPKRLIFPDSREKAVMAEPEDMRGRGNDTKQRLNKNDTEQHIREEKPDVIGTVIKVIKKEDDYLILDHFEQAEAAYRAGICYVPVKLAVQ